MNDFVSAPPEHQKKEKNKARELRKSVWWRQQLGRRFCYYCEQKFDLDRLTMDHKIPIARGGKTSKKNVVVCCKDCNSKKKYYTAADLSLAKL